MITPTRIIGILFLILSALSYYVEFRSITSSLLALIGIGLMLKDVLPLHKIIGGLFIILGGVTFYYQYQIITTSILVVIGCGIILLFLKRSYGTSITKTFLSSFNFKKDFLYVMLYDFLFWAVLAGMIVVYSFFLQSSTRIITGLNLNNPELLTEAGASEYLSLFYTFFAEIIIGAILLIIIIIFINGFFSALVWSNIQNSAFNKKVFWTFTRFSTLSTLSLIILLVLFAVLLRQEILITAIVLFFILFLHANMFVQSSLTKHNVRKSLKELGAKGLKVQLFIAPYILAFVVYFLIAHVTDALSRLGQLSAGLSLLIFIFYFSWLKVYAKNIKKTV